MMIIGNDVELIKECMYLRGQVDELENRPPAEAYAEVYQDLDKCRTACEILTKKLDDLAIQLKEAAKVIATLQQIRMWDKDEGNE